MYTDKPLFCGGLRLCVFKCVDHIHGDYVRTVCPQFIVANHGQTSILSHHLWTMQTACLNLVMMNSHQLSKNLGLLFKSFQYVSMHSSWTRLELQTVPLTPTLRPGSRVKRLAVWSHGLKDSPSMASPDAICRVHVVRTVVFIYVECSVINMVFPRVITSKMSEAFTNDKGIQ